MIIRAVVSIRAIREEPALHFLLAFSIRRVLLGIVASRLTSETSTPLGPFLLGSKEILIIVVVTTFDSILDSLFQIITGFSSLPFVDLNGFLNFGRSTSLFELNHLFARILLLFKAMLVLIAISLLRLVRQLDLLAILTSLLVVLDDGIQIEIQILLMLILLICTLVSLLQHNLFTLKLFQGRSSPELLVRTQIEGWHEYVRIELFRQFINEEVSQLRGLLLIIQGGLEKINQLGVRIALHHRDVVDPSSYHLCVLDLNNSLESFADSILDLSNLGLGKESMVDVHLL